METSHNVQPGASKKDNRWLKEQPSSKEVWRGEIVRDRRGPRRSPGQMAKGGCGDDPRRASNQRWLGVGMNLLQTGTLLLTVDSTRTMDQGMGHLDSDE